MMNKLTYLGIKLEAAKERRDHDEEEIVQGMIDVYRDGLDAEEEEVDGLDAEEEELKDGRYCRRRLRNKIK